ADYGIPGERNTAYTGVWTKGRKIASIGVHARDWVTWHGFALNVTTDLSYFDLIIPCGIDGVTMTSIEREIDHSDSQLPQATVEAASEITARVFGELFGLEPVSVDADAIAP